MLDANSDVRDGEVNQMFSALGLREVLLEFNADLPLMSTFARNLKDVPIDAIFAMPTVMLQAGGYFGFGEGPGLDHRCFWMEISYQTAFGYSPPPVGKVKARHLTYKDPRVRQRYNELYRPFVVQHGLDMRSYRLQTSVTGPLNASQVTEFEAIISTVRAQCMEYATHRCRKLKMSEVDFNPEINTLRSRILAWNLQISKLHGC
jgi:hypothetical protein